MHEAHLPPGVVLTRPVPEGAEGILTTEALAFVASLARRFEPQRRALLAARTTREAEFRAGALPGFLPETEGIRQGDWRIAGVPAPLADRRVEITGPAGDRKMVINALNSGASTFMADLEDALSPTWENVVQSQVNLYDATRGTISLATPEKSYRLNPRTAQLLVRPRGWHLVDKHVLVDGAPVSGSLLDFGLHFFHNAAHLASHGLGAYYYLPKMEGHREARLWNDVFLAAQAALGLPVGTVKATVLIETLLAAFEMDEILYELRDHIVGLNCGRWDYIFSAIKKLRFHPPFLLPDRAQVGMTVPFLRDYTLLTIRTCHRRGAYAIGGMAAQIPIRGDEAANAAALQKVRDDKLREVRNGHDGTWVAHPALVPVAMEVFEANLAGVHQLDVLREDVRVTAEDLLAVPSGTITMQGVRTNVDAGVRYLAAWLGGSGAVPLNHLMEDAATVEISRAQLWQWIRHPKGVLDDGRKVTLPLVRSVLAETLTGLRAVLGDEAYAKGHFALAGRIIAELTEDDAFAPFLTLRAYEEL